MAAVNAFGATFSIKLSGSSFTAVGEVTNIDALDVSVDDIETTSHGSSDGWKQFMGGLKDGGKLKLDLNFDPASHGTLLAAVGATKDMKIVLPANSTTQQGEVTFQGYINEMSAAAPYDDKLSASLGVKVSGPVAIAMATKS